MPYFHNTELGKTVAVPSDAKARTDLRRKGYALVEQLVDTSRGEVFLHSIEEHVQSGAAVGHLCGKERRDPGHEGEPAFMRQDDWSRLSETQRKAFLKAPPAVDESLIPKGQQLESQVAALAHQVAQSERIRELEAKLAATKLKP